jgi:hypothetical protein
MRGTDLTFLHFYLGTGCMQPVAGYQLTRVLIVAEQHRIARQLLHWL